MAYADQLRLKQSALQRQLSDWPDLSWLPPVASNPTGFRCKAKMAVGGTLDAPSLGLVDADGGQADLADCLLYPPALQLAFAPIKRFITLAGLTPYSVTTRRGELKFVLLTLAEHSGELMLRLVLRSREALPRIERQLPALLTELPQLKVVSANLQPLPAAIIEGEEEIPLSSLQHLQMEINGLPFFLRPRGFFQTNPAVAAALYRQARSWVDACGAQRVLDLFCGVGGFALHCADGSREVLGVEISEEAIDGARRAAALMGTTTIRFEVGDATASARLPLASGHQIIIVNPPRRGLGQPLCVQLQESTARWVIYSSCNPVSLTADLRRMPSLRPVQAQLLDMFPHTAHSETLVLLQRIAAVGAPALANRKPPP